MYYVYILFSKKDKCLYTGSTANLKSRYSKHQKGFVKATKARRPLSLVYYEAYLYRKEALQREVYLKGGKGKSELKIQLCTTLQKLGYKHL